MGQASRRKKDMGSTAMERTVKRDLEFRIQVALRACRPRLHRPWEGDPIRFGSLANHPSIADEFGIGWWGKPEAEQLVRHIIFRRTTWLVIWLAVAALAALMLFVPGPWSASAKQGQSGLFLAMTVSFTFAVQFLWLITFEIIFMRARQKLITRWSAPLEETSEPRRTHHLYAAAAKAPGWGVWLRAVADFIRHGDDDMWCTRSSAPSLQQRR